MWQRLLKQFQDDRHAVPRRYGELLESLASGIPPVTGTGIGLSRLLGARAGTESFGCHIV